MAKLNLGLSPRQRGRPLERRGVAILVGQADGLVAGRRNQRRKGDVDALAWRQAHAASQADDRVEHGADGVGEGLTVGHRARCSDPMAATEKPRAVGFPLYAPDGLAFDGHHVRDPDRRLGSRPRAPRREEGVRLGHEGRLHEQVGERGVGRVRRRRRQHDLGVRRHVDLPGPRSEVGERDAPNLGIVFRGHDHRERGRDPVVSPGNFCPILGERHLITLGLHCARLVAGRPALATLDIAKEHVRPSDVARDILAPSGDRQTPPAAVPGAGGRDHHDVPPVRQEVGTRRRSVR